MADLFTVVFPFVQSLGFFFQTLSKKPQKNISHHMIVTNYYWTQFSIQKRQNALADLGGGAPGARPPPLRVPILSF